MNQRLHTRHMDLERRTSTEDMKFIYSTTWVSFWGGEPMLGREWLARPTQTCRDPIPSFYPIAPTSSTMLAWLSLAHT